MEKLLKSLRWIDDNILKLLISFFLVFIPLFPKIPVNKLIPQLPFGHIEYTYISLRPEDFIAVLISVVFIVQLLRRKVSLPPRKYVIMFAAFWAFVFLAYLWGMFINTVPYHQVGLLHVLRRVEYMIFFFIAFASVKSMKDLYIYLKTIVFTIFIVCVYGIGQKYFGFPAVQTMNPAFAQGLILYLTPEARVSSTFAGHYDLAAYLVLLIPMVLGIFFNRKNWLYFLVFVLALFVLILTASRISFIAYVVSVIAYLLFMRKFKGLTGVVILTIAFSLISSNLIDRFMKTVQIKQLFVNEKTGEVIVPQTITTKELPAGSTGIKIGGNVDEATEKRNKALVEKKIIDDLQNQASLSGHLLSASEAAALAATMSAKLTPVNTVVADISNATRLQVEWPRAIKAFLRNPLLGTGPSSITEATDNDYLRSIGETGALGFGSFAFILLNISWTIFQKVRTSSKRTQMLYFGFIFGLAGLLINASYIDVFEASKVAFVFWCVAGAIIASLPYIKEIDLNVAEEPKKEKKKK